MLADLHLAARSPALLLARRPALRHFQVGPWVLSTSPSPPGAALNLQRGQRRGGMAAAAVAVAAAAAGPPADTVDPQLLQHALQHYPRIILGTGSSSRKGACSMERGGRQRTCTCARLNLAAVPPRWWLQPDATCCARTTPACCCHPLDGTPPRPCLPAGIMDELAAEHGFAYEIAKADIDEKAIRHEVGPGHCSVIAFSSAPALQAPCCIGATVATAALLPVHCIRYPQPPPTRRSCNEFPNALAGRAPPGAAARARQSGGHRGQAGGCAGRRPRLQRPADHMRPGGWALPKGVGLIDGEGSGTGLQVLRRPQAQQRSRNARKRKHSSIQAPRPAGPRSTLAPKGGTLREDRARGDAGCLSPAPCLSPGGATRGQHT